MTYNPDPNFSYTSPKQIDSKSSRTKLGRDSEAVCNRLFVERGFGKSSFDENSDDNVSNDSKNRFDTTIGRGMPMRAQFTAKKTLYDENKYLDFNLTDKAPKSKIQSNDGPLTSYADINASTTTLTNQIDPMFILQNSIHKLGSSINEYFTNTIRNNFIINTFGLYSLFGSLYLASDHATKHELEKFFNFPSKDLLYQNLLKIQTNAQNTSTMFNIKNLIIAGNTVPYNHEFYKSVINKFCVFARVDISNPDKEAEKLNFIINKMMGTPMRNPIVPANLTNLQIMFMTVGILHPVWTYPFEKIIKGTFMGSIQDTPSNFLLSMSKSYLYFEDNEHQLIEFKCGDRNMAFGILLPKKGVVPVSNENIYNYINHAQMTVLDEVRIPMFSQNLKLRYNNTLKNLGLNSVFLQVFAEEFFPKRVELHDIVQNIKIIIDGTSIGKQDNSRGYRSINKFIADRPFMYYVRLVQSNVIAMNGFYCG